MVKKQTEQTKEVATIKRYDIIAKPEQVKNMALVLQAYVNKNKLSVDIQGKPYCMAEGWMFAGLLSGLDCRVTEEVDLSTGDGAQREIKWKATALLYNKDNEVVGRGVALCSSKESKKKSFDEYAILSMAQTRAIGKAYRNKLGWVMKMAGYEGTPAEEMKTPEKDLYSEIVKAIESSKTTKNLFVIKERVEGSKKLDDEQKKTLDSLISKRVDILTSDENVIERK